MQIAPIGQWTHTDRSQGLQMTSDNASSPLPPPLTLEHQVLGVHLLMLSFCCLFDLIVCHSLVVVDSYGHFG